MVIVSSEHAVNNRKFQMRTIFCLPQKVIFGLIILLLLVFLRLGHQNDNYSILKKSHSTFMEPPQQRNIDTCTNVLYNLSFSSKFTMDSRNAGHRITIEKNRNRNKIMFRTEKNYVWITNLRSSILSITFYYKSIYS